MGWNRMMNLVTQTATLMVLILSGVVVSQNAPSCVELLFGEVANCFQEQGLVLNVQGEQQDPTTIMREAQSMDPQVMCQKKNEYKQAITCALSQLSQCLQGIGMEGAIPDTGRFKEGMDVVCAQHDKFDSECFRTQYGHILSCAEDVVKEVVKTTDRGQMTMTDIICLSADVNYDCTQKHMQTCGQDTLKAVLDQLNNFQVPRACTHRKPGRSGRTSYVMAGGSNSSFPSFSALLCMAAVASLIPFFGVS